MTKLCCTDCFNPNSIKEFIKKNGIGRGYCDFCDKRSSNCIEPSKLEDLFRPLVNLYSRIEEFMPLEVMKEFEGQTLAEKLVEDWMPFSNDIIDDVTSLLYEIFGDQNPYPYDNDGIDFSSWVENPDIYWGTDDEPSEQLTREWKEFCSEIIGNNRFFPQKIVNLDNITNVEYLHRKIPKGMCLYRARKTIEKIRIQPKHMGMPPAILSTHGRANPVGIPYLYLASDEETGIQEVRPNRSEYITVGKFRVREELFLFDLSNQKEFDPYFCGDELWNVLNMLSFFHMLGDQLSKPIDPSKKDIHYIPTQYLCEFIKNTGFDGVIYKSNVGRGLNLALFSESKVKCTRTTINKVELKFNKIYA